MTVQTIDIPRLGHTAAPSRTAPSRTALRDVSDRVVRAWVRYRTGARRRAAQRLETVEAVVAAYRENYLLAAFGRIH